MYVKKLQLYISLLFILFNSYSRAEVLPDLGTILNSQINNSIINIPKGIYTLDIRSKGAYTFANKNNLIINGNGSTIICNKQSRAFQFLYCTNVVFSNLVIEYDPPCSTQGTIIKMSADKRTWDVEIHDGYPIDNLGASRIQVYGKSTLELLENFGTTSSNSLTKIGSRTIQFTINGWGNNNVQIGDYAVLDVLAVGAIKPHTIFMSGCKNMELDSITVYDSNCFSFLEYDCERSHYYRCIVTRKPFDSRYKIQCLRAGIADGIHSKFAKVGPVIEECRIEYNGDDCIAINGDFYPIYDVDESTKYVYILIPSSTLSNARIKTGDNIVCVNIDGSIRGNSIVNLVSGILETPSKFQINTCLSKFSTINSFDKYQYGMKVKVENWISGITTGDFLYSRDRIGSGFKVINNKVGHNRSRGILIKASDGIIDGNSVIGSEMSGIVIAPEFFWMEAGCSNNVEICNNTIRNCMFRSNMTSSSQAGAISVVSQNSNEKFSPAGSLNNISIHNNIITDCPRPCVVITSTKGVKYYQNTITPSTAIIRNHGSDLGVQNNNDIWMINVEEFITTYSTLRRNMIKKSEKCFAQYSIEDDC